MYELFGTGQSTLAHFSFNHVIENESHSNTGFELCFATLYHTKLLYLLCIAESEREGTRAETRIGLSAKRTSPFKSAGGQFSRLLVVEECG